MARIEKLRRRFNSLCHAQLGKIPNPPPLKRVCSLISYRLVSAMRHMVDQSLPELLAYSAKLCIELLLFRTYVYTTIYTYIYVPIQVHSNLYVCCGIKVLLNGNKFCPRLKVWPEVFGQIGAVRSACLLLGNASSTQSQQ